MSKDYQEVRREILAMHKRVKNENYFEILGVSPEDDDAKLRNRFRELAKKWHVDRFSNYDLGEEKAKVQEIFSAINKAHKTLTDPDLRVEYEMEIDDGPNIGDLLDAENAFRSAKGMLDTGSYRGAHEKIKYALELNPEEKEYQAYYLYTEFLLIPKDEKGRVNNKKRAKEIFRELDQLSEEMPEKDWLLSFLGTVSLGLGEDRKAEGLFREALMQNKQNRNAKRQLRLIRMRRKNEANRGFFDKLLEKIRG